MSKQILPTAAAVLIVLAGIWLMSSSARPMAVTEGSRRNPSQSRSRGKFPFTTTAGVGGFREGPRPTQVTELTSRVGWKPRSAAT